MRPQTVQRTGHPSAAAPETNAASKHSFGGHSVAHHSGR
jgi:hypothetical protein